MENQFIRTEMLFGQEKMERLKNSCVAIFGIGGVGSYVSEGLARCGVGHFILIDHDKIDISNINRQIHATFATIGQPKVLAMKERILSINPEAEVITKEQFYLPGEDDPIGEGCQYIVDAVDTVTAKIEIILQAQKRGIPVISSMGTGNKLDPTQLEISDIYNTSVCPLAKVMRRELKRRGIKKLKVIYSKEEPLTPALMEKAVQEIGGHSNKRQTPGSVSFVPSSAGLIICSEVIKELTED